MAREYETMRNKIVEHALNSYGLSEPRQPTLEHLLQAANSEQPSSERENLMLGMDFMHAHEFLAQNMLETVEFVPMEEFMPMENLITVA